MDKLAMLKKHFGFDAFRPGQEGLINALLSGRDVLGIMPTGAGKSMCYQLPAMLLEGTSLVISPLISLMKDQVSALTQAGIPAAFINSSLSQQQYGQVLAGARQGQYRLLFIAPERLSSEGFLSACKQISIPLVAVDEAHCVSQWGQDFRPSYLQIAAFIKGLARRPAVGAFTATATETVREDIAELLELQNPLCLTTGFDRPNLYFAVERPKSKAGYLKLFLQQRPQQSGIIYCATRKSVEAVCEGLRQQGIAATRYHAGLSDEERRQNQEDFVHDRARVMVATNAFGMGIDKSNVSFVLHYNMPKNIESYYQEAGRAGRDGQSAECIFLFSQGDVQTARFLIQNTTENEMLDEEERQALLQRDMQRLDEMVGYCKTTRCLRAHILDYFGQHHPETCGNCGSCKGEFVQEDITTQAQKILSAVARVERRYPGSLGVTLIVRLLHGSKDQRVLSLSLNTLPTYGIMKDVDRTLIREYMDYLAMEGYLVVTAGQYPVVRLGERAREVLFEGANVSMKKAKRTPEAAQEKRQGKAQVSAEAEPLFSALRALRMELAREENVPAYIVFSNATLKDMAQKRPRDMGEMMEVSGVGEVKAARYGEKFLKAIDEYFAKGGL